MIQRLLPLIKVNIKKHSNKAFVDRGAFYIQFLDDIYTYPVAPAHAKHFTKLVQSGFYDSVFVHRVIKNTLVQMGDPMTRDQPNLAYYGSGDCGKFLKLESTDEPNVRGIVGMARGESPNSASCQFYVCLDSIPKLNGKYTIFGKVIKGLELLDTISATPPWETKDSYRQTYAFPNAPKSPIPDGLRNQIPSEAYAMFPEVVTGEEKRILVEEYLQKYADDEAQRKALLKETFSQARHRTPR